MTEDSSAEIPRALFFWRIYASRIDERYSAVNGECVIHKITRVSKPGRRHYESVRQLTPVVGGLGISVLTTSAGVITDQHAKRLGVGGEILCHIW